MPMAAQLIPRAVKRTVPTLHATAQIMLELSTRAMPLWNQDWIQIFKEQTIDNMHKHIRSK